MRGNQGQQLSGLISDANAIAEETLASFGRLTEAQLNWQPGADRWSIAQCLDHLVTTNGSYAPVFEQVVRGEKKTRLLESLPWLPGLWGKLLIKAVSPESARKLKAPPSFQPSRSGIDGAIIRRFTDQQQRIIGYMKATEDLDLEKLIITSPVLNLITYSLMDAYRIIINHERRHLLQARRVLETEGFPN
ncbi:MAG TPA: DinB family protein [Blastocatellia bacterium]|nr:DinB family protein [Blastocatellia bacterium]